MFPHCGKGGNKHGTQPERPERACANGSDLACPLSEGRGPSPLFFAGRRLLGTFWHQKVRNAPAARGGFSRAFRKSTKQPSCRIGFLCTFSRESTQRGAHAPASGIVPAGSLNDHERLRFSHDRSGRSLTLSLPRRAKCAGQRPSFCALRFTRRRPDKFGAALACGRRCKQTVPAARAFSPHSAFPHSAAGRNPLLRHFI